MSFPTDRPPFSRVGYIGYNVSTPPVKEYIRLSVDAGTTPGAFTLASTTQIGRIVDQFETGTSRFPLFDFPTFISDTTALTMLHEGNDTDFTRLYQWQPPYDCVVDRIEWNVGMMLNVSAYTSDNYRITSVDANITVYKAQGQKETTRLKHSNISMTNMTAVDNQIVILNFCEQGPFNVYSNGIMEIDFDINTVVGTGTYQKGILSAFPYQNTGGAREYSTSGFNIYYRPLPLPGGNVLKPAEFAQYGGGY